MTDQPFSGLLIIGEDFIFLHKCKDDLEDILVYRSPQSAVCICDDVVGTPGVKSGDRVALLICPERELCFIAVSERIFHADDRFHDLIDQLRREAADAFQIASDFLLLEYKLSVIGHFLDLASPAPAREPAFRFHPVQRRLDHLHKPCVPVIFLCLYDLYFCSVADHSVLHKERVTVGFPDPFTACADIRDLDDCCIIFLHVMHPMSFLSSTQTAYCTQAILSLSFL